MRRFAALLSIAGAVGALVSAPASARPVSYRSPPAERDIAATMSDPQVQESVADAVGGISEAMLDISLAPFARALDAAGDHEAADELGRHSTLRDVAGPDGERVPREMARRVPEMMGAMGGMTTALERMLPELARAGEQMRGAAERAGRSARHARERTRDWSRDWDY